jgi:hypothetical protein
MRVCVWRLSQKVLKFSEMTKSNRIIETWEKIQDKLVKSQTLLITRA